MARLLLALAVTACTAAAPSVLPKQKGMSFASGPSRGERNYGSAACLDSLRELKALGVNWISIMPFGFARGGELRWGNARSWENDDSLRAVTRHAHELGIKVLLKPHVWGEGEVSMADYQRFVEHYARLAAEIRADAFSIGNEQKKTSSHFEKEWRGVIASVRAIYGGPITYGANFDELESVPFWDAVDWIGVSAYFPLTESKTPTRAELVRAWKPIVARLAALSAGHRKPIVFTEIGYRSSDGAAWRQWEIPRDAPPNPAAQRAAYEAFFEAVWPQPWLTGVYPWKWFSFPDHETENDYDVKGKPAEDVIRRNYAR